MKSIQFSFNSKVTTNKQFGYELRAGYILSNVFNTVGITTAMMMFPELWKRMSFETKLKFVEKNTRDNENSVKFYGIFRDIQKRNKSIKHLSGDLLRKYKVIENTVSKALEDYGNAFIALGKDAGINIMTPLWERGLFNAWTIDDSENSKSINSKDKLNVLNHTEPVNANFESVWLMSYDFFKTMLNPKNCCTVVEGIAPNRSFLIKAFELPDLNILSQQELEALNHQLPLQIGGFLETVDDWAKECYKGDATTLFLEALQPMFEVTNNLLSNNDILDHCNSVHFGKKRTHVFMGAISQIEIWNFYCNEGVISEEEKQELEEEYKNNKPYLVPVMLFGSNEDLYAPVEVGEEEDVEVSIEDVVSAKKFISLDDE